jgi:hypothetical protein
VKIIHPPRSTEPLTLEQRFHPATARGPFFHATDVLLKPGELIVPAEELGHAGNFAEVDGERNVHYQSDMAYAHTSAQRARQYVEHWAEGPVHVYRVEPCETIFEDPENFLWGNRLGSAIICRRWRVVEHTSD